MKFCYLYTLLGICLPLTINSIPLDAIIELDALEQHLVQDIPETLLQNLASKLNQLTILLEQTPPENSLNEQTLTLMADIITTILETKASAQPQTESSSSCAVEKGIHKSNSPLLIPDSTKQLVINTISTIAGNVAAIAAAPRNPQIVGANIAQIFMGIVNLMRQVLSKSKEAEINKCALATAQEVLPTPQREQPTSDTH